MRALHRENLRMEIKTETPGFDVKQSYIAYIVFYKNCMTFQ